MLEYPACGVEYGSAWIVREILREHLTPANTLKAFEESVAECYPESTEIGWIEYDTVSAIKELDPVSWDIAHNEWLDAEVSDGNLVTFYDGLNYYTVSDIEGLIAELAPNWFSCFN